MSGASSTCGCDDGVQKAFHKQVFIQIMILDALEILIEYTDTTIQKTNKGGQHQHLTLTLLK